MKKVIFISALAIAAAVSCTKSDIVDTKFNEQISFETYTGRDAMTKASVVDEDNIVDLGLYGFYTGKDSWGTGTTPNLWDNAQLTKAANWVPTTTKYWANATDKYTFLAYSPYTQYVTNEENANQVLTTSTGANPKVTYKVPTLLKDQIDLLYANSDYKETDKSGHVNMVKPASGTVNLVFKHALARLTVTAAKAGSTTENDPTQAFDFDVKKVEIRGKFNTSGTLTLKDAVANTDSDAGWNPTAVTEPIGYTFYDDNKVWADGDELPVLNSEGTNAVKYAEKTVDGKTVANNYLMMIPTNFSTENNAATLVVTYTTIYEGQESNPMTKHLPINTNFRMGKAYSINLLFSHDVDPITFSVEVDNWSDEIPVNATGTGVNNPDKYDTVTE